MKDSKLKELVTQAITLDRSIKLMNKQLDGLKAELVAEAEQIGRQDLHRPTEGGGSSVEFIDDHGEVAEVTFPGPTLKDKIDPSSKEGRKTVAFAGNHVDELFDRTEVYILKDGFRDICQSILAPTVAAKLIKRCEKDSSPSVKFKTKPAHQEAS